VPDALEAWFIREILPFEGALVRYLAQRRRNPAEIDDLRHDIYVRILESARHARPTVPKAFLFITARNLLIDRARRDRIVGIEQWVDLESSNVLVDEVTAERQVSGWQQLQRLAKLFDRLPRRCREVVWMRRIQGLTQREVAQRLKLNEATVEKHLYRGLRQLSDAMHGHRHRKEEPTDEQTDEIEPQHGK
jgi:RNA polymerase sigma factor (sigma-70 family)